MSKRKPGARRYANKLREMDDVYSDEVRLSNYSREMVAFSTTQRIDAVVRFLRLDPDITGELLCEVKVTLNNEGDIFASVKNQGGTPLEINVESSGSNRVVVKASFEYDQIGSQSFLCTVECRFIDYIIFDTYLYKWRGEQEPPRKAITITGREHTTISRSSVEDKPYTEDIQQILQNGSALLSKQDLNTNQLSKVFKTSDGAGNRIETQMQLVNASGETIKKGMAWFIRIHNMKYLKKGLLLYIITRSSDGFTVEEIFRSGDISNLTLEARSNGTVWLVGKDYNTDPVGVDIQESPWVEDTNTILQPCQADAFAFERQQLLYYKTPNQVVGLLPT